MDTRVKRKKRQMSDPLKIVLLGKRLEVVCKRGADGFAHYEGDYSDFELAREIDCSIVTVRNLRTRMMGLLRKPAQVKERDDVLVRLTRLEAWARSHPVHPFFSAAKLPIEREVV
jgi:hypothetical protein